MQLQVHSVSFIVSGKNLRLDQCRTVFGVDFDFRATATELVTRGPRKGQARGDDLVRACIPCPQVPMKVAESCLQRWLHRRGRKIKLLEVDAIDSVRKISIAFGFSGPARDLTATAEISNELLMTLSKTCAELRIEMFPCFDLGAEVPNISILPSGNDESVYRFTTASTLRSSLRVLRRQHGDQPISATDITLSTSNDWKDHADAIAVELGRNQTKCQLLTAGLHSEEINLILQAQVGRSPYSRGISFSSELVDLCASLSVRIFLVTSVLVHGPS